MASSTRKKPWRSANSTRRSRRSGERSRPAGFCIRGWSTLDDVVVRRAGAADAPALARLAQLEGRELAEPDALVAAIAGVVRAAASLNGRDVLADPFQPTTALVDLLRMRADQLRGTRRGGGGAGGIVGIVRGARTRTQARPTA